MDEEKLEKLRGVIVPLFMPLNEDERVDEEDLRKLIRYVLDGGVHILFVSGGCGEFPSLRVQERQKAIEITIDEGRRNKAPVIVGVGDCSVKKSLGHIELAGKLGADFVLAPSPYYFRLDQQGVKKYYTELASQGGLPLIMYNVPAEVKVAIEPETAAELAKLENIIGIKDSSGDIAYFQEVVMKTRNNPNFRPLIGEDNNTLPGLMFGAYGLVPGSSNIMPKTVVAMYNEVRAGNYKKAQEYFEKMLLLIDRVYHGVSYSHGGCKTALQLMGIFKKRYVTSPMMIPTHEETELIKRRLQKLSLL